MELFITGVGGQLGHDVVNEAIHRGYDVIGSDITHYYNGTKMEAHLRKLMVLKLYLHGKMPHDISSPKKDFFA